MTIQAVNNVAFKGLIRVNNADREVSTTLKPTKFLILRQEIMTEKLLLLHMITRRLLNTTDTSGKSRLSCR